MIATVKQMYKLALVCLGLYVLVMEVQKLMHGFTDAQTVIYTLFAALTVFYNFTSVAKALRG